MTTIVSEAMHAGVEWVIPDTSIADVAKIMREHNVGAVPVGENDRLIGMVTDRDIALRGLANGRDPDSLTARDVMSEPIIFCRASEGIEDAVRLMETKQVRRLPVIDENKRMVGMLALGDIAHSGHRELTAEVVSAVSSHHG